MRWRGLHKGVWRRQGVWGKSAWLALAPASLTFSLLVRGRHFLYDTGLLAARSLPLKAVSVGNLTVGGTGKTPTVLWLAEALRARGHRSAIIARGYGGSATREVTVVGDGTRVLADTAQVGDEAVMLARAFAGVVLASRDRYRAAVLAKERFGMEVAVLDDAFQHRAVRRDVDLVLVSAVQGVGNGWLLPAGPLRESPRLAAARADLFLVTKGAEVDLERLFGVSPLTVPVFHGDLEPDSLVVPQDGALRLRPLRDLVGKRVLAVSGIAEPGPFYHMLGEWGAQLADVLEFDDHHVYTVDDWQTIAPRARRADLVVTTEKDLMKLERFPFARGSLMALRVCMKVDEGDRLLAQIEARLRGGGGAA